jgi:hypothetical protein
MPYQPFQGLQQPAPQGLQMQWQPNVGGEQSGGGESGQAMQGLGSAADMLQQWLANRRKGIAMKQASQITDLPTQSPQNIA